MKQHSCFSSWLMIKFFTAHNTTMNNSHGKEGAILVLIQIDC